ncbi:MAG: cellulose-binding protein [Deltaproteobacteria bacterium]|nr:cellulose-binding protein [Deltaproteobacteria bacterium]
MPLGDSITQSNNTHKSYRYPLFEKLTAAGREFDFIGSLKENFGGSPSYPNPAFDQDHEGHWGWRVDQILNDLPGWLNSYTPDVALIHLGTNDAFQSQPTQGTMDELKKVIGLLRGDNERVVILLARLIPSTQSQQSLNDINGQIGGLAEELNTDISPVIVVNQNEGFNANGDTFDGIHPNEGGEEKMADKWFSALINNWPKEGGACAQ